MFALCSDSTQSRPAADTCRLWARPLHIPSSRRLGPATRGYCLRVSFDLKIVPVCQCVVPVTVLTLAAVRVGGAQRPQQLGLGGVRVLVPQLFLELSRSHALPNFFGSPIRAALSETPCDDCYQILESKNCHSDESAEYPRRKRTSESKTKRHPRLLAFGLDCCDGAEALRCSSLGRHVLKRLLSMACARAENRRASSARCAHHLFRMHP